MTRTLRDFLDAQYDEFKHHLVSCWAVDQQYLERIDPQLKPIHKRCLSLACAATVIGFKTSRNEYIEGVVEISQLCLVLAMKGLENPTCVLLRQSVELVLKHIFFATHPVEYEWARSREDYRSLTFQNLLEYLSQTEEFRKFPSSGDICVHLNEWFSVLSRHVHVHSKGFMGYCEIGSEYKPPDILTIRKLNQRTKEIWPRLIASLLVQFPKRYFRSSALEQRLIKSALSGNLRRDVDQYLIDYR